MRKLAEVDTSPEFLHIRLGIKLIVFPKAHRRNSPHRKFLRLVEILLYSYGYQIFSERLAKLLLISWVKSSPFAFLLSSYHFQDQFLLSGDPDYSICVQSFLLSTLVSLTLACDSPGSDACASVFTASSAAAAAFCKTYTTAKSTATTGLPAFVSSYCSTKTAKASSACSCFGFRAALQRQLQQR